MMASRMGLTNGEKQKKDTTVPTFISFCRTFSRYPSRVVFFVSPVFSDLTEGFLKIEETATMLHEDLTWIYFKNLLQTSQVQDLNFCYNFC